MQRVSVGALEAGMTAARNVYSADGLLLVARYGPDGCHGGEY